MSVDPTQHDDNLGPEEGPGRPVEDEARADFVTGLRGLADAVEANPIPVPVYVQIDAFVGTREELAAAARAIPGRVEKDATGSFIGVGRKFGSISYLVSAQRQKVCVRRQVGTRSVERKVPVETRIETVEEPVYEYDCEPLLAP